VRRGSPAAPTGRSAPDPRWSWVGDARRRIVSRPARSGALLVALVIGAAACGSVTDPASHASTTTTTAASSRCTPPADPRAAPRRRPVSGSIRVLAAASLTDVFADLASAFEESEPAAKVATSFGASSDLVARIHQGATADVLATADTETMDRAVGAGDVAAPLTFTCNTMTILTARGNPLHIEHLADLGRSDVRFALCAEAVPCGHLAREVLRHAGVDASPVGSVANVKAVVAKVTSGEVDAGIVYVTDARAVADTASSVTIPASVNVTTAYPIAVTRDADRPGAARAFVDFVRSAAGQKILDGHGFGAR
jgi:molybdate transport system substrate-binding protein